MIYTVLQSHDGVVYADLLEGDTNELTINQ